MTNVKVISVLAMYRDKLLELDPGASAMRMDITRKETFAKSGPMIDHLFYMCVEAMNFAAHMRMEKAMRWLGFIQGVLVTWGVYSIDECGKHNMPDPDEVTDGSKTPI